MDRNSGMPNQMAQDAYQKEYKDPNDPRRWPQGVFTGKNIRVRGAEAAEHQGEILYFSGDKLHWVKNGRLIQSYDASSGQFGPPYKGLAFTETWKNSGPIPPGLYQFEPKEISQPSDPVK
jgi:hypothetical protein